MSTTGLSYNDHITDYQDRGKGSIALVVQCHERYLQLCELLTEENVIFITLNQNQVKSFIDGKTTLVNIQQYIAYTREHVRKMNLAKLEELTRQSMLAQRLKQFGLEIRGDSVLCQRFISNGVPTIDTVVEIMVEMSWLHKKTDYGNLVKSALSNMFNSRDNYQNYDSSKYCGSNLDDSDDDDEDDYDDDVEQCKENTKMRCIKLYLDKGGILGDVPESLKGRYERSGGRSRVR